MNSPLARLLGDRRDDRRRTTSSAVPSTNWSSACSTSAAAVATNAPQPKAEHQQPTGSGS